ncbi:hypothetical protein N7494_004740 [Penicillium frequentans]|uniref:Cell pattern formation-associated protein stuA n=1 Tax=Penicillium frequentans TaxID=3151616 RepID=A0AAD6GGT7_9EURO|nr:hypothetical protein N7494_004740 [Penicillium glabrum]
MSRSLPKKNNPLILADAAPAYGNLVTRRRLGRVFLSVKPEQVDNCNASKPENLGVFEYAYLESPLPQDLKGSEIHSLAQSSGRYYLMRRRKDNFISATGMFRIAFPWAKAREEGNEREYLKSQRYTSPNNVAGNIWISPTFALELAKEYNMYDWVRALLDPVDIVQSRGSLKKHGHITPPPKFELPMDKRSEPPRDCSRQSDVLPSKDSTFSCMAPLAQSKKDMLGNPSPIVADDNLQKTLATTALMEVTKITPLPAEVDADETEVKANFHIVNPPVEFAHSQTNPNILEVKSFVATADIRS